MHPIAHPRNAVAVGLMFLATAFVYWIVPHIGNGPIDLGGVTLLGALGIAMGVTAYVLVAGSPRD
ncbi:MAG TPA: hypothetical protein VNJ28_07395 [Candidatus Limnocylindrales bacterium]|nr:hypothetical protein [Candidatus Limnocylindrales bacterium]